MVTKVIQSTFFIFLTFGLLSCSNTQLTKNIVKKGELVLAGGVSKKEKWGEEIEFKRTSWYRDFTLLFDALVWETQDQSKFLNWFSAREKSYRKKCQKFYILMTYALDGDLLSNNDFLNQLKRQGLEFYELPEFKANLKLHPHHEDYSLQLYKVGGLCQTSISSDVKVSFPGFLENSIL